MRARQLTAALLALGALTSASVALAASPPPHVRLVKLEPKAVVRGTGFLPLEHLLVRLTGVGVASKRVIAGATGAFQVSLRTPPARACGQYLLVVVRPAPAKPVRVKIGPPECAPDGGAGG
jgi:hypothetical protein